MKFLNKIKDGIKMVKDKTINKLMNIGTSLKNKENSQLIGLIFTSVGIAFLIYTYIPTPQQILK